MRACALAWASACAGALWPRPLRVSALPVLPTLTFHVSWVAGMMSVPDTCIQLYRVLEQLFGVLREGGTLVVTLDACRTLTQPEFRPLAPPVDPKHVVYPPKYGRPCGVCECVCQCAPWRTGEGFICIG